MENTEIIGKISGLLVLLSVFPYAFRVYQGKIKPNIITWSIWSLIGLSLLLNYNNVGADDNIWPAVFGFINPLIITIIAIWKNGEKIRPNKLEYFCLLFSVVSMFLWLLWMNNENYSKYALFAAITADLLALLPTIFYVWKNPSKDRPLMWLIFSLGYGLAIFSITTPDLANYSLPVYMFIGSIIVSVPLIKYQIKEKNSFKEWL